PLKDVTNKIFITLSNFSPGRIISEAYRSAMLFNSFEKIDKYLITMIIISIAMYGISLIKVKIRWEE
ncbi:MAG: ABC transporter permease, partial [Clostridium sp.]